MLKELVLKKDMAWNSRDWATYSEVLSEQLMAFTSGESASYNKQEYIARAVRFCEAFPDCWITLNPYIVLFENGGSQTCSVARIKGTMTGELTLGGFVFKPTHNCMDISFAVICKWHGNQIIEQMEYFDTMQMISQLQLNINIFKP